MYRTEVIDSLVEAAIERAAELLRQAELLALVFFSPSGVRALLPRLQARFSSAEGGGRLVLVAFGPSTGVVEWRCETLDAPNPHFFPTEDDEISQQLAQLCVSDKLGAAEIAARRVCAAPTPTDVVDAINSVPVLKE